MRAIILLGLVTLAYARNLEYQDFERDGMVGYIAKFLIPRAEELRKEEEEAIRQNRIIGGQVAQAGQFPYQAGLLTSFSLGTGVCGGSLVSANRVITAAHCWFDGRNQGIQVTVVLGSAFIFSGGNRQTTRAVIMHPQWNPDWVRNDVAVIRLNSNVGFSGTIAPIALPTGAELSESFAGVWAVASGFGRTGDNIPIPNNQQLRHVSLNVITNNVCSASFPGLIVASTICTSTAGGRSTCVGDSGGPLTLTRGSRRILIGVTSFGSDRGCQAGFPAAFARVSSFRNWFAQQM